MAVQVKWEVNERFNPEGNTLIMRPMAPDSPYNRIAGLSRGRESMSLAVMFVLYRVMRVEYVIMKLGYHMVEWVGAKQQGRVVTRVPARWVPEPANPL